MKTGVKPSKTEIRQEGRRIRQYVSLFELLYLSGDDVLYRRSCGDEFFKNDRLCLPYSLQDYTIKTAHGGDGGHMGMKTTQTRLLSRYYFPGCMKAVERYVGGCLTCQRKAGRAKDQRHTLVSVQEGISWAKVSIDFVGPLPISSKGNRYMLTAKDCFTRWVEAFPMQSITTEETMRLLETELFSRWGIPQQIHSDQGAQFTSPVFIKWCEELGIKKTVTPSYNPKSNQVERSHKDIKAIITALLDNNAGKDWQDMLHIALLALRTARNRHTGVTPFYANFGKEVILDG